MLVYAFDYAGTLNTHPELVKLANSAFSAGHSVHVVTANPDTSIDMAPHLAALGLKYTAWHMVLDDGNKAAVALRKARILAQIGAHHFWDDVKENVEAARDLGIYAIQVS